MKKVLVLLFCLIAKLTMGQVIIDPMVVKGYEKAFKRLSPELQKVIKWMDNNTADDYALFTTYKLDTLNKQDLIQSSGSVHLYNADTDKITHKITIYEYIPNTKKIYCTIHLQVKGDSLIITTGDPVDSDPYLVHHIHKNKVVTTYDVEHYPRDTTVRLNLSSAKTSFLTVPVKTFSFKLNTFDFSYNSVNLSKKRIFGEASGVTEAYYQDDTNFRSGYAILRLDYRYYFKSRISYYEFLRIRRHL